MFGVRDDGYISAGLANGSMTIGLGSGFYPTISSNTFVGISIAQMVVTGNENAAFGDEALMVLTSGIRNASFGSKSLHSMGAADHNSAFGAYCLYSTTSGSENSAFGFGALFSNTVGTHNSSFGSSSLQSLSGNHSDNSAFGWQALNNLAAGDGNVAIGAFAGKYELGSNKFYLNNQERTNTAGDKNLSLLYGKFDAAVANQFLVLNGKLYMQDTTTGTFWSAVLTSVAGTAQLVWTDSGSANAPA